VVSTQSTTRYRSKFFFFFFFFWVKQQNDYFIAKSQPYALAHCSRELQNLEAHEQNVRELSVSLSHTHTQLTRVLT
jgi:hypothetical protein